MASDPSRPPSSAPAFKGTASSAAPAASATPPGLTSVDFGAVELNRDMSQYIRTYAKDVARASNQPAPAPSASSKPESKVTAQPKVTTKPELHTEAKKNPVLQAVLREQTVSGVSLPEVDSSPVNRPGGSAKEFAAETVDLKKDDSDGIFTNPKAQKQVPPPARPAANASASLQPKPFIPMPAPARVAPPIATPAPTPSAPPIQSALPKPVPPLPRPIAQPAMPPVPPKEIPTPTPSTPRPAPIAQPILTHTPTPAPTTNLDDDREAVLARLRLKLAASRAGATPQGTAPPAAIVVPTPQPTPLPPPPVMPPQPVAQAAPITAPIPSPIAPPVPLTRPAPVVESAWQPPAPPRPIAQPVPQPMPMPPQQRGPEALHTYSSDFAVRIDQEGASKFSVLAAQQDAGQGRPVPEATGRRSWLPVALAVLLIMIGGAGLFAAYRFINPNANLQQTLGVPSLIFADEKMELTGPDYRQSLANATNEPLVAGNILVTYVTTASSTSLGLNEPQPGGALIRLLNLGAPDILLRNVDLVSTVGIINAGQETRPFFILRVNSYERTYAGMLGWEQRMLASFDPLYPPYADPVAPLQIEVATTTVQTATTSTTTENANVNTTSMFPMVNAPATEFVDIVVANYDARALKDTAGRTLIIYGYSNSQTLIIARDEAAFTALIARLAASTGL